MKSRRPWREVVHITEGVGVRGSTYWGLTLSCGHWMSHPRPSPRPGRVYMRYQRNVSGPPNFAPKKKRCFFCPEEPVRG